MFLWIEFGLSALSAAIACTCPKFGLRWFERAEDLLGRLARRRALSVATVGLTALAVRAALLPILPIPQPGVLDEFGYLLQSDTFAHGRLTNPTHPMWVHFESFYIFWHPTYNAKYYPAQGLIMGLGQILLGHPFWGVWLSVGLMCAGICWMLQGWLPPGWALLGGFLAVIRLGTFSYWANSYWGGAVAATGGALVLGALPRIKRTRRVRDALLMGLGFAILANSRPYEGVFLGLPVAGVLGVWMFAKKKELLVAPGMPPINPSPGPEGTKVWWKRVVTPLILVLVLTACAMGYYYWRVTGSPWRTPYTVYEHTYNPAPFFSWQALAPLPTYHHPIMRDFYRDAYILPYDKSRSTLRIILNDSATLVILWSFYLGAALTLPLLGALVVLPYGFSWKDVSSTTKFLLLVCGTATAGSLLPIWFAPHYSAAITCAILALVLQAMRRLRRTTGPGRLGAVFLARAVPIICLLLLALRVAAGLLRMPQGQPWLVGAMPSWCARSPSNMERAATLAKLRQCDGKQLAIVRYGFHHEIGFHEWVYNEADIDGAKVLWARDMGPDKNQELIDYFQDHRVWLVDVEADDAPPKLLPYTAARDRSLPTPK